MHQECQYKSILYAADVLLHPLQCGVYIICTVPCGHMGKTDEFLSGLMNMKANLSAEYKLIVNGATHFFIGCSRERDRNLKLPESVHYSPLCSYATLLPGTL